VIQGKGAPFPWSSLDRVTRAQARTLRNARLWAAARARLGVAGEALSALVGARVRIHLRTAGPAGSAPPAGDATGLVGVVVEAVGSMSDDGILLELEAALACVLVARALRRPVPVLVKPVAVSERVAGAVAAVLAAALRKAQAGAALRVRCAETAPFEAVLRHPSSDAVALGVTVVVGDDAFSARAIVPRRVLQVVPSEPLGWNRRTLSALGATPLPVPVVACTVALTVADVAALGPGDVVVLAEWPLAAGASGAAGKVFLSPPAGEVGVRAEMVDGSRIVLRGQREALVAPEGIMEDEGGQQALIDAIGDVPVVVRVEVGEATLSAREWADVGPGDVVGLGRRLGDQVVLRIGGVPVARGELVDLEGEIGVRIVARLAEETTAA
jgi:type III secretion protein Q